jgi:NAD(P)-dependent dehydrogenase (short-subunit alcohol dehydrogenase family)
MGGNNSTLYCNSDYLAKSLDGEVYLITGGNSGIGLALAGQLAKQGATVIIGCRRIAAGNAAAESVSKGAAVPVKAMEVDLAYLDSIRKFAQEFNAAYPKLTCLVNNAGVMNPPKGETKDGFETQFGTNHLGHFLLTNLLLPKLKESAPSRVVNLSSCAHGKFQGATGHIDFDDLNFKTRRYNGWVGYGQSKLANVLFTKELAKKLEGTGVTTYSVHPGFVRSNLINHTVPLMFQPVAGPYLRYNGMIEPWEGIQSSLHCCLTPPEKLSNGEYYAQNDSPSGFKGGFPYPPSEEGQNPEVAARLWTVSAELVGLKE